MRGILVWITGLAGSGKSTIGKALYQHIRIRHANAVFLDGDSFREILGNDLGHAPSDRLANAMRIARMCQFLVSQDIIVICATMSLFSDVHAYNREHIEKYFEVFVDVDIEELIRRDQKGLYSAALAGNVKNVVGIDLPYDPPQGCDLVLDNDRRDELAEKMMMILNHLDDKFGITLS